MTDRNQKNLHPHSFHPFSHQALIPPVIFHDPECPLCLNRTVHPQKRPLNTFQIFYYLFVYGCQFHIQTDAAVFVTLFAFLRVMAATAALTYIDLFLSSILVSFYLFSIGKYKLLPIRAAQVSVSVYLKIYRPKRIFTVFSIFCLDGCVFHGPQMQLLSLL